MRKRAFRSKWMSEDFHLQRNRRRKKWWRVRLLIFFLFCSSVWPKSHATNFPWLWRWHSTIDSDSSHQMHANASPFANVVRLLKPTLHSEQKQIPLPRKRHRACRCSLKHYPNPTQNRLFATSQSPKYCILHKYTGKWFLFSKNSQRSHRCEPLALGCPQALRPPRSWRVMEITIEVARLGASPLTETQRRRENFSTGTPKSTSSSAPQSKTHMATRKLG